MCRGFSIHVAAPVILSKLKYLFVSIFKTTWLDKAPNYGHSLGQESCIIPPEREKKNNEVIFFVTNYILV